jgi:predicted metal-dependent phosphoesterase TrpH
MKSFRYDIHTHTKETSKCGKIPAAELVARYAALGYDGIAITDHLHDEFVASLAHPDDWDACVDAYLTGWRAAKEAARVEMGGAFDVVLGLELRYPQNDNDFLVFGVDEAFLRANPYLYRSTPEAFFDKHGSRVLIIQAHPFRSGCFAAPARCMHGIEVFNGNPRHDSRDECALAFANEHPRLLRTCASDAHQNGDAGRAAMLFDKRIGDSRALCAELARNSYTMEYPRHQ